MLILTVMLTFSPKDGWTALTYAANNGDYEVCRLLIGEGAAINDRDKVSSN